VITQEFVDSYSQKTIPWGFSGMGEVVYLRTYSRTDENDVRETWPDTIRRCINGAIQIGTPFTQEDAEKLFDHMFNLRCSMSGRALWQMGTPIVNRFGAASLQNCYFLDMGTIEAFEMLFNYSMLGGGVGYSVERAKIHDLPKVKTGVSIRHERTNDADLIVPDSREGWGRLLHAVLKSFFYTGKSFTYSTILVRGKGAPLKSFGGQASGPEDLIVGIQNICDVLNARSSKKVRSIDVLDVCNIIGEIVVSGSSRRSAQIAIGDPDDFLFLNAKNWSAGNIPAWRQNSNNSIYADSFDEIIPQFWKGYNGEGEPYGLINRKLMRTVGRLGERNPDPSIEGVNPCAEIGLADGESCNLATIFLPKIESYEQFLEISRLLYLVQKATTELDYPYAKTNTITKKNRRLGQNVTGIMQCSEEQLSWLAPGYLALKNLDEKYSDEMGIPKSIRLTTIQPGGTQPLLPGVLSATGPAFSPYYIRRVRFGSGDVLIDALRKRGHKVQPEIGIDGKINHTRWVVDFPCQTPKGATLTSDVTAIDQLEVIKRIQTDWADNAVSSTVYYRPEELPGIKAWLAENYEHGLKSVSFLLHADHNFPLPPLEEISETEYHKMVAKIDTSIPLVTNTNELLDLNCETGACPIR
jgi:ribonucleoside-triphosphate reductase